MRHLLPKPVDRFALRIANRLRHHWRQIAKPQLHAVTVLVRDDQGRVLFIRHSYGPPGWTLPGGGIVRGEPPAEAARREIREELGLDLPDPTLLATFEETVSGAPQTAHVFAGMANAEPRPDGREVVEARFFTPEGVPGPISALTRRRLAILAES